MGFELMNIMKENMVMKPNDSILRYMTSNGRQVVTKLNTSERKATHIQYVKKDGSKGKQTLILKQL